MSKFHTSASYRKCPKCQGETVSLQLSSGDFTCLDCGYIVSSRVMDEGCEWRTYSSDDRGDSSASGRAADKDSLYGASMTEFVGGTIQQRQILQLCQEIAADSKELRVLKHIHLISELSGRMEIPSSITVSLWVHHAAVPLHFNLLYCCPK